ncbi:MAG: lipopolysaccharide biosynthesis protein [Cyanobacteriota bacterium]|nr:lipopolysaccharide biosynthesis protein [Cyanobacteriota bacterium]
MSLKQKVIKGALWSAIQSWLGQVISFVVFFVLARLLEPEAFGLIALAAVFLAFMQIFLNQGFAEAIIQKKELEPEHLDTAFWIAVSISLLLTLLGIGFADVTASVLNEPLLKPIVRWLSLSFLFSGLSSVQQAILRRELAFKSLAARTLIARFIGGAIGVVMALLGFGVWSIVCQKLSEGFAGVLLLWWVSDWRPGFKVSKRHFKELFGFGINIVGFNVLYFFNRHSDDLLIGYFLGPVALGYYSVAYRLLMLMTNVLTQTTAQVALPTFSRLQQEPERMRSAFYSATQLTSTIAFPCFLGMAALAPELVPTLFGQQWEPSIPVMRILAFIGVLHSVSFFQSNVILAMGKPGWRLGVNCLNAGLNVAAFALVVLVWGKIEAVAAAYVIRGYLLSPIPLLMIRKLIGIEGSDYFRQLASPLGASIIMVGSIFAVKYLVANSISISAQLVVCVAVGAIIYGVAIALLAPKLFGRVIELVKLALSKSKVSKTLE